MHIFVPVTQLKLSWIFAHP